MITQHEKQEIKMLLNEEAIKKRKKDLVDCMLLGIYFFLSIKAPTIAIAMIMATTPIARYMSMSELETDDCAIEVGVGIGVDAALTVANVCA